MFRIIITIIFSFIVNSSFANTLPFLSKIDSKKHEKIKSVTSPLTEPDLAGKYKGSCVANGETYDNLSFVIYSSQNELIFDDYDFMRHTYKIGGSEATVSGQSAHESSDSVTFSSVFWNNDSQSFSIRSIIGSQFSDSEAPFESMIEEIMLKPQGNKLIVNLNARRFDDLNEYAGGQMDCTFTKTDDVRAIH